MAITNQVDVKVGKCLRRFRFARNRTLADLAAAVGTGTEALLAFENGQQRIHARLMVALCKELNVRASEFFAWSEDVQTKAPQPEITEGEVRRAHGGQ
ncbi:transcriptional regulator with XRE-family HTH domain [Rhodoblastus acidophilus]|uniref:helix-turn-helix domain-containing protein n=1 Tax=Rhodoblastus acidophilus TaxID=1074 RepID=UPI00222538DC|nr:helix-turn-helix transcriptional regulator [Rhodoblastus acidophilus]MCW2284918.1 transcriptional regulator with XRE-family HTH domain [Rhodoblastus acidophilus]MCW2333792.1 transcriptional regulator with XRE-family HTH domain [Rhodoblastus acidophilus]